MYEICAFVYMRVWYVCTCMYSMWMYVYIVCASDMGVFCV